MTNIKSVFGTFSHELPKEPQQDSLPEPQQEQLPDTGELPLEPLASTVTGLILQPSMRIDGDAEAKPWNKPETDLWNWLRSAEIELVEERVLDGSNGVFWARIRDSGVRSAFLKVNGIGRDFAYQTYAEEFLLNPANNDLLRRESAAYEVAKACGCEDLVPPLVCRDIDPVALLSDAMRESIASREKITPNTVDEAVGVGAILQLAPKDFDNFAEQWGTLNCSLGNATDRLRHSMYRALALDFLLGTPDRTASSFLFNRNTDRIIISDMTVSFPHPGISAEKYIQQRSVGWGRANMSGLSKIVDATPAHMLDYWRIFSDLDDTRTAECLLTFEQVSGGLVDDVISTLVPILVEQGVPDECIAGFLVRVAYLASDPIAVLKRPFDLMRNVLVPIRKGFALSEALNASIIEYVSYTIGRIFGDPMDVAAIIQQQAPQ